MTADLSCEPDYQRTVTDIQFTRFLPGTTVEIIRDRRSPLPPDHMLFDFDGTLSLIREGWVPVMVAMMVEVLQTTGTGESVETLESLVTDFVLRLNGKQTIYQMIQLAEEVRQRGVTPLDPATYKGVYHDRLMERIRTRREALRTGAVSPAHLLVPFAEDALQALVDRGVHLYLASGTDQSYVEEEVALLGLDRFFGAHVYGAVDNYRSFSKAMVIERILRDHRLEGTRLLGFGDGYVELENVKSAGGTAIAVASDEAGRSGRPDAWKRDRLIGVGADIVIPDFRDHDALWAYLWNTGEA